MQKAGNDFLDHGSSSDELDEDQGYDSEAAEISKVALSRKTEDGWSRKRRKLSHSTDDDDSKDESLRVNKTAVISKSGPRKRLQTWTTAQEDEDLGLHEETSSKEDNETSERQQRGSSNNENQRLPSQLSTDRTKIPQTSQLPPDQPSKSSKPKPRHKDKTSTPGVVYLSSLPPYLKPSALRNLLAQRGFSPITRLFLAPASKASSSSKKNSRQLYTEGWIEFASKKLAKRCAEALNATPIGGRKGGFYHDDIWNFKYLRGMGWNELMAGIREERREEEGRRDEERRMIARETKMFVEGVEEGKRLSGIKRKKDAKVNKEQVVGSSGVNDGGAEHGEVKRVFRQFEIKGSRADDNGKGRGKGEEQISDEVKQVLGKIF